MSQPHRIALLALGLSLGTSDVHAQSSALSEPTGPRIGARQVGVRAHATTVAVVGTAAAQPAILRKRGVSQMIIGGAALVGGAIVGDDVGTIVMLGGLGYGLYGLYLYLQ